MEHTTVRLDDGSHLLPITIFDTGTPCPRGPCDSCPAPCPPLRHLPAGVYEMPYMLRPGYRHFAAIVEPARIVAAADVRLGLDARPAIQTLRQAIARRGLALVP